MRIQTAHTLPLMTACIVQYRNSGLSEQSALIPQEIINDTDQLKNIRLRTAIMTHYHGHLKKF